MSAVDPAPLLVLPDGRGVWVYPLTFDRARIGVGVVDTCGMDDVW